MPRITTPESKIAALGSESAIESHYLDEALLNELFALAELTRETVKAWEAMPAAERESFLSERDAAIDRGDWLAARPAAELSPLLREEHAKAKSEWAKARTELLALK